MMRVINGDLSSIDSKYANATAPTQVCVTPAGSGSTTGSGGTSSLGGTSKIDLLSKVDVRNWDSAPVAAASARLSTPIGPKPPVPSPVINGTCTFVDKALADNQAAVVNKDLTAISLANTNSSNGTAMQQQGVGLGGIPTYKYAIAGIGIAIVLGTSIYLINR